MTSRDRGRAAAVDAVLGPPDTGWDGGARTEADGHAACGGHAARGRRHLLLPVLHAVQAPGRLDQPRRARTTSAERLTVPPAEAYGVATFYALFRTEPRPPRVVHVCDDIACRCRGAERAVARARTDGRPGGRARRRRRGHLAAQPMPGPVRPRRRPRSMTGPARSRSRASIAAGDAGPMAGVRCAGERAGPRRPPARRSRRSRRSGCCAAWAGRPVQPRRLPGRRRVRGAARGRWRSARRA